MPTIDQIALINGIHKIFTKVAQSKQTAALKELASGQKADSTAEALATSFHTEELTIPVVQKNIELANSVLSTSEQSLASVAHSLSSALATAADAESATPAAKKVLIDQFNYFIDQTKGFVNNATVNGLNLIGQHSKQMAVNTTIEGGKLTIANEQADANSLGVQDVASNGWSNQADIAATINQIRNALNRITSIQSRFAAAQAALSAAHGVNQSAVLAASSTAAALVGADIGTAVLEEKQSRALGELGTWTTHHIHRHGHK